MTALKTSLAIVGTPFLVVAAARLLIWEAGINWTETAAWWAIGTGVFAQVVTLLVFITGMAEIGKKP